MRFAGTNRTGAVLSVTETVNDLVPVLPRVSEAEQTTVVSPTAKVLPLAGVQLTGRVPSTTSVAVAPE